jgi:hypothetical protein
VRIFKLGMWTRASRGRMAGLEKRAKRCPTDLTDEERAIIRPFLPEAPKRIDVSEAMIHIAMASNLLRRFTH